MVTETGELTRQCLLFSVKAAGKSGVLEDWLKALFGPDWCFRGNASFKNPQGWGRCLRTGSSFSPGSVFIREEKGC